jgi:PII-like signaling protein
VSAAEERGELLQMRFHFGERDRNGGGPLEDAVMGLCGRPGVRAAVLLRGVEGFGAKHRLRTDRLLSLSEDTPLLVVAVGESAEVEALAEEVRAIAGEGLIALEEIGVMDRAGAARTTGGGEDEGGRDVVKATVWGPRRGTEAPHLEAVAAMRRHGVDAATVLLGVDGVLEGERRRARFVAGNRGVPALTVAVGEREAIEGAVAEVDGVAHLVTVEAVVTCSRYARASHHGNVGGRVTLVTSEIARGHAHPRYVELIHELRRRNAAGTTALRGVWGFRGDEEPHGDRVLALRREVPMIVEVVDAPERAGRWEEVALELAREEDVVHSQRVPRVFTLE